MQLLSHTGRLYRLTPQPFAELFGTTTNSNKASPRQKILKRQTENKIKVNDIKLSLKRAFSQKRSASLPTNFKGTFKKNNLLVNKQESQDNLLAQKQPRRESIGPRDSFHVIIQKSIREARRKIPKVEPLDVKAFSKDVQQLIMKQKNDKQKVSLVAGEENDVAELYIEPSVRKNQEADFKF